MKLTLNILLLVFLGFSVSFCSLLAKYTGGDKSKKEKVAQYVGYRSSGTYKPIKALQRSISSETQVTETEDLTPPPAEEPEQNDEAAAMAIASLDKEMEPEKDPIPIEKPAAVALPIAKVSKVKKPRKKLKNGMYRMKKNCDIRETANGDAKKVGRARKGKKLWVENHDSNWAKIYKKSGPAYISRGCL